MIQPASKQQTEVLAFVDHAVRQLQRVDGTDPELTAYARTSARRSLGRALASLLQAPELASQPSLRAIVDGLIELVEQQIDVGQLLRFRDDVRALHATLAHRVADGPAETLVVLAGTPDAQADFHRVLATSSTTAIGLLGSTLAGGPAAAMSAGVMAGALTVACTGMGAKLGAAATLTILDRALKEALVDPVPVSMVAWQYDRGARRLTVASAGHRALWRVRDGAFEAIRTDAQEPLGLCVNQMREVRLDAAPDDLVVAFTMGVLQQDDAQGRSLREQELRLALLDARPTAPGVRDALRSRLNAHLPLEDWRAAATIVVSRLR